MVLFSHFKQYDDYVYRLWSAQVFASMALDRHSPALKCSVMANLWYLATLYVEDWD